MENVNPNRHYSMNHPALPRLASSSNDLSAEAIRVGDAVNDEHILAASTQHSKRELLLQLNLATPNEVMASKKRETAIIVDSVGLAPIGPGWAEEITLELQAMRHETTAHRREMNGRFDQLWIWTSQNTNRTHSKDEKIVPVPNNQGAIIGPPLYPEYEAEILAMNFQRVNELLQFYEIVAPPGSCLKINKSLLCARLGLKRLADAYLT